MALISQPGTNAVDDQQKPEDGDRITAINPNWRQFFGAAYNILIALTMSGTTTQRPTGFLWVGRPYLDTTLNKPIWVKTTSPIVWIDATGGIV